MSSMNARPIWLGKALFCLLLVSAEASAQSTTIDATVTITRPSAGCTVTAGDDLSFGTLQVSSTTGGAVINPTNTASTAASVTGGVTQTGTPGWGTATVVVSNTTTATTVALTFPTELRRASCTGASDSDGDCAITFSSGTSGFGSSETASTFTSGGLSIPASNVGTSTTRYFRLGGTLSGVDLDVPAFTYEADVSVTVTCGS